MCVSAFARMDTFSSNEFYERNAKIFVMRFIVYDCVETEPLSKILLTN